MTIVTQLKLTVGDTVIYQGHFADTSTYATSRRDVKKECPTFTRCDLVDLLLWRQEEGDKVRDALDGADVITAELDHTWPGNEYSTTKTLRL